MCKPRVKKDAENEQEQRKPGIQTPARRPTIHPLSA